MNSIFTSLDLVKKAGNGTGQGDDPCEEDCQAWSLMTDEWREGKDMEYFDNCNGCRETSCKTDDGPCSCLDNIDEDFPDRGWGGADQEAFSDCV